ncbi:hypothetical protein FQR65_LT20953 [Abscondita terminalis]|nr:hypothetical protein FQR65_LT20953 [Abscondita terminalis]
MHLEPGGRIAQRSFPSWAPAEKNPPQFHGFSDPSRGGNIPLQTETQSHLTPVKASLRLGHRFDFRKNVCQCLPASGAMPGTSSPLRYVKCCERLPFCADSICVSATQQEFDPSNVRLSQYRKMTSDSHEPDRGNQAHRVRNSGGCNAVRPVHWRLRLCSVEIPWNDPKKLECTLSKQYNDARLGRN